MEMHSGGKVLPVRMTNGRETGDVIMADEDDGCGSTCAWQKLFWHATFMNSFHPSSNL